MEREIHFYTEWERASDDGAAVYADWIESMFAVRNIEFRVNTLQMGLLNDAWERHWECGDRVFIHDGWGVFELKEKCERTDRLLRQTHDIFKLWKAGEFRGKKESGCT